MGSSERELVQSWWSSRRALINLARSRRPGHAAGIRKHCRRGAALPEKTQQASGPSCSMAPTRQSCLLSTSIFTHIALHQITDLYKTLLTASSSGPGCSIRHGRPSLLAHVSASSHTRDRSGGSPAGLHSRAGLSSMAFVIIPGIRIPGSELGGGPVIIVGRLLFLSIIGPFDSHIHTTCVPATLLSGERDFFKAHSHSRRSLHIRG